MKLNLEELSKEQLRELVTIYARNVYAIDGVWFQSIEQKEGMDEAMYHDRNAISRFSQTEAKRIKNFLKLPEQPGLEGLETALSIRFSALGNPKVAFVHEPAALVYKVVDCRVQTARKNKGMPYHPCKSVGILEHDFFAKTIDNRIECETISCYPDITDESCACAWRFTLSKKDEQPQAV